MKVNSQRASVQMIGTCKRVSLFQKVHIAQYIEDMITILAVKLLGAFILSNNYLPMTLRKCRKFLIILKTCVINIF